MKEAHPARTQSLLLSALILGSSVLQSQAYYHPDEGRWLSRDPIGERGGINLHAFCLNAPIIMCDRRGHDNFWGGSTPWGGGNQNAPAVPPGMWHKPQPPDDIVDLPPIINR